MFLRPITDFTGPMQHAALILNTVILIITLITIELYYSERPASDRRQLFYFLPLFIILIGILLYAVYGQIGGAS